MDTGSFELSSQCRGRDIQFKVVFRKQICLVYEERELKPVLIVRSVGSVLHEIQ